MDNRIGMVIAGATLVAAHCLFGGAAFAQLQDDGQPCPPECVTDSMEIVTWYPSPYNEYEELRLYPTQRDPGDCNNDKIGLMYYDHGGTPSFPDNDKMMICKGTLLGWQEVGSEGFWKFADSSDSDIYYTKSGNVGIGTDTPQAKLHIVKEELAVTTFSYTGGMQSYSVLDGITSLTIEAFGAQGGNGGYPGIDDGGYGGSASATIAVTSGDILYVYVGGNQGGSSGGTAGWNGGGAGGVQGAGENGGGGGGASDVRKGGITLANRIIVAGGGGGGGTSYCGGGYSGAGGAGGGTNGSVGINGQNGGTGGGGGTQQSGGGAGSPSGNAGALGQGGAGANGMNDASGGGGGGGYFGGGGGGRVDDCLGAGGGGGGGSGYIISTADSKLFEDGVRAGNGLVKITPISLINTALYVEGVLSVNGRKDFEIDHPLKPGMKLVHSSLEGPEIGVYYRGQAQLDNGQAIIILPDYFEALTSPENRTVLFAPIDGWAPLYVEDGIKDGKFVVKSADSAKTEQKFFWEVKAVRKDIPPLVVEKE